MLLDYLNLSTLVLCSNWTAACFLCDDTPSLQSSHLACNLSVFWFALVWQWALHDLGSFLASWTTNQSTESLVTTNKPFFLFSVIYHWTVHDGKIELLNWFYVCFVVFIIEHTDVTWCIYMPVVWLIIGVGDVLLPAWHQGKLQWNFDPTTVIFIQ